MSKRFLRKEIKIDDRSYHFEFIPFDSERRFCTKMTLTSPVTHVILSQLLQGFDFNTPWNMPKPNQVEVVITPRLSSKFL